MLLSFSWNLPTTHFLIPKQDSHHSVNRKDDLEFHGSCGARKLSFLACSFPFWGFLVNPCFGRELHIAAGMTGHYPFCLFCGPLVLAKGSHLVRTAFKIPVVQSFWTPFHVTDSSLRSVRSQSLVCFPVSHVRRVTCSRGPATPNYVTGCYSPCSKFCKLLSHMLPIHHMVCMAMNSRMWHLLHAQRSYHSTLTCCLNHCSSLPCIFN